MWGRRNGLFLDNGTVRVVYDTGRPEFVIRTRGVDPYDDSLYCRPQTAFAAWRVFDVIPFRYTSFWGFRGPPPNPWEDVKGGPAGSGPPFDLPAKIFV